MAQAASERTVAGVIGESAAMRRAMDLAKRAAGADITVLLSGETGTGKSLLAGFLHRHSLRRDAPFIAQNCGALPEALCESELFGYRRGAFSGAVQDKPGLFEAADGGTIFLDEVTELGLASQVKLLQVLQEGVLRRLGDTRSRSVDVRVIAATNKDLYAEVERGSFREDLYYRLNVVSIVVPSLRERPEDIPRLAAHFLHKHGPRINPGVSRLGGEALRRLCAYDFPGNVRELDNLIQRALLFTTGPCIEPGQWFPARGHGAQAATGSSLADLEHHAVLRTIALHEGNLARAAHTLGISRTTLWRRMKGYRLSSAASWTPWDIRAPGSRSRGMDAPRSLKQCRLEPLVALFLGTAAEPREVEEPGIEQVRGDGVPEASENSLDAPWRFLGPGVQHALDRDPLEVGLRAAQRTGNEGEGAHRGIGHDVPLGAIGGAAG